MGIKILTQEQLMARDNRLLRAIQQRLPALEELLDDIDGHMEGAVYRYYHGSFKIYGYQEYTERALVIITEIAGELNRALSEDFVPIAEAGTGKTFGAESNEQWSVYTRPIVEALFHARYFVAMMVKYGRKLEEAPTSLPQGWAALLELFGPRGSYGSV